MDQYIGKQIDKYIILNQEGIGGMAVVYKAYDVRLERDVAVKLIRTDEIPASQHERLMKRFEREAKALAAFSHPNIIPIYEYGVYEGVPYLVVAYLPGGTLKERIQGPVPLLESFKVLIPISDALAYAHKKGILHRDVKPSNIIFNSEGMPLLTDFGVAKLLETNDATLTGTGVGVGTPEYMAPEQWQGKSSEASDQYALGVVLYELLTGQKPYTAETPIAIALKQLNEPLRRPSDLVPELPESVEKVIYKVLARNQDDRYKSMSEFREKLDMLLKEIEYDSKETEHSVETKERDQEEEDKLPSKTYSSGNITIDQLDGDPDLARSNVEGSQILVDSTIQKEDRRHGKSEKTDVQVASYPLPGQRKLKVRLKYFSFAMIGVFVIVGMVFGFNYLNHNKGSIREISLPTDIITDEYTPSEKDGDVVNDATDQLNNEDLALSQTQEKTFTLTPTASPTYTVTATNTSVPPTAIPPTQVPPTSVPPTAVPPTSPPPTQPPPTSVPPTAGKPTNTPDTRPDTPTPP